MSQSTKAVRASLYAACTNTIYAGQVDGGGAPVLVTYGPPGSYQANYIVAIMGSRQPVTRPTMGTGRSREKMAEVDVVVSVFVPGTEVAQQTASEACDDLVDLLDSYFRTSPNETLGGACVEAWVSNVDGPTPDLVTNPETKAVMGRVAESIVTVTARIRY